jgi:phosphocarrier protein HPr
VARLEQIFSIVNSLGLHARPASQLVQIANRHKCEVHIVKDGTSVNAKSIMGVLTLAAARGSKLTVICEGDDAESAMSAMGTLIAAGFGEK